MVAHASEMSGTIPGELRTEMAKGLAFLGGKIFTADSGRHVLSGVYAEDGVIRAVGHADEIRRMVPSGATLIEIPGKTLVPGFIDGHTHMLIYGTMLDMIDLRYPGVSSVEDVVKAVAEAASSAPEGQWIRGWGFDYSWFPDGRAPTRWDLDPVSPHHPVFLVHASGHHALANTVALKLSGVEEGTSDPKGGRFLRDSRGRLTGMLQDAAQQVVMRSSVDIGNHGPSVGNYDAPIAELVDEAARASALFMAAGVTTVIDAQVTSRELHAYMEARRQGRLCVKVCCMPLSNHLDDLIRLGLAGPIGDGWLSIGPLKIYCDGDLIACTSAFSEPYEGQPTNRGRTFWTERELRELVFRAHQFGLQIGIHTVGDRAMDLSLGALEVALRAFPREDHRHRVEHACYVTESQLERIASLGVIPVSQTRFFYELGDNFLDILGPSRANRLIPLKSQLDLDIPIALSSDSPVVSYLPMDIIHGAVSRRTLKGTVLGADERISVEEAIVGLTIGAAHSAFLDDERGSIEVGKSADFALIGGDLLGCAADDIPSLPVEMTVIDGQVAYPES